ncbi:MAG: HlyD family efflux transporter periplasmic adaptor subunit [Magnetococcales bacterium]|nr:HlyD family efflux transporter periplasmic adaptor subunit [Magnetococcales bacterium]
MSSSTNGKGTAALFHDQPDVMANLLRVQHQIRHARTISELRFLIVNSEAWRLVPSHHVVLWQNNRLGRTKITEISGVDAPDSRAPYMLRLNGILRAASRLAPVADENYRPFHAGDLAHDHRQSWGEDLAKYGLWLPMATSDGAPLGALVLFRNQPFSEREITIAVHLAEIYAHALLMMHGGLRRWKRRQSMLRIGVVVPWLVLACVVVAMGYPVTLSVLAPMEITARDPVLVRAPLEGVVETVHVHPNATIKAGDLLLRLDDTTLKNQLEVAEKSLEITLAELRQSRQLALGNRPEAQARLEPLQKQVESQNAELLYLRTLLARIEIRAAQAGVVLFDDADAWTGRPVALGEKILTIADPNRVEVTLHLPMADAIPLNPGNAVSLFPDTDPDHPIPATLRFIGFQPKMTPAGVPAFLLRAELADGVPLLRIGTRGIGKIDGERVTLFHMLFRRPMIALRQYMGW